MRRALVPALALVLFLLAAATASAHPTLVTTDPVADTKLGAAPAAVTLTFSEPVELARQNSGDVVDESGESATRGPAVQGGDTREVRIPLRPGLADGTYTVRYSVIGADSHVVGGVFVFGVGDGALKDPYLAGIATGPSETGPWGTSSRFLELVGLGGLIGLIAFRWLVWAPALRRPLASASEAEREAVTTWGRDAFWVGFGVLAVGAMIAEGYLLVVQSASVLGTSVWGAIGDATGISEVLGGTRFGSLVQLRGALLFGLFALGAALFIREYGSSNQPRAATLEGPRWSAVLMGGLLLAVLGGIAAQGHANVADVAWLQIGTQLVHLVAVAVWIVGLAMIALIHVRLPRLAPDRGSALAARVLARFSKVALIAVAVAVVTGVIRSLAEMDDPTELWDTSYGRSVLIKVALLIPIGVLALYNRKVIVALRPVRHPNAATVRLVRRLAGAELILSVVIVVVASVLVAQVPGAS
ncbi:MAG TPA: CopD family protein [Miltoncostaeaceae bacterium]|nr:CopD family protein [Miltoncostaeaceae bacterium]